MILEQKLKCSIEKQKTNKVEKHLKGHKLFEQMGFRMSLGDESVYRWGEFLEHFPVRGFCAMKSGKFVPWTWMMSSINFWHAVPFRLVRSIFPFLLLIFWVPAFWIYIYFLRPGHCRHTDDYTTLGTEADSWDKGRFSKEEAWLSV